MLCTRTLYDALAAELKLVVASERRLKNKKRIRHFSLKVWCGVIILLMDRRVRICGDCLFFVGAALLEHLALVRGLGESTVYLLDQLRDHVRNVHRIRDHRFYKKLYCVNICSCAGCRLCNEKDVDDHPRRLCFR